MCFYDWVTFVFDMHFICEMQTTSSGRADQPLFVNFTTLVRLNIKLAFGHTNIIIYHTIVFIFKAAL